MFAIHPTSGTIVLTGRLDHTETSVYEMEILRRGPRHEVVYGGSGISSMAKLTVHVSRPACAPVITAVTSSPSELDRDPRTPS